MSAFQAVILGIIQGLAEFLPISSSGHLVLFQRLFGITTDNLAFDVVVHLGTLVSVFIVLWRELFMLIKKPFQKLTGLLIVGTIPAMLVGFVANDFIESLFGGGIFLGIGFAITGCMLIYADRVRAGKKNFKSMGYMDAAIVGLMQAIGVAPGVSRSGSTITGGLLGGLDRDTAARFSFLLSIPIILGASVFTAFDIYKQPGGFSAIGIGTVPLILGFVSSALAGCLSVSFMLALVKKAKLTYFAIYVFALAVVVMLFMR